MVAPSGLPKERPDQANGGARHCTKLPRRDHSVTGGRDHLGIGGAPSFRYRGAPSSRCRGRHQSESPFKAHVGADADTALVEEIAITPANVNDGKAGPEALPDNPGEVFADSAYRGQHFRDAIHAKGGTPRIIATAMWGRDEQETLARLEAWNQPIHRVRGRIEKIFGTWKRSYGLRRMRWRGLAKASIQVRLTAIAYNLKRTLNIITAAAA